MLTSDAWRFATLIFIVPCGMVTPSTYSNALPTRCGFLTNALYGFALNVMSDPSSRWPNANGPLIAEVQQARLAFDEQWDQDWGVQLAKAHMEKIGDHTYWQTVGQRLKKMQAVNGSVIRRRKDEKPWKIDVVPDYLIRTCLEHTDFPEILAYAANGGGWHNKTRGSVVKELVCKHSELWV